MTKISRSYEAQYGREATLQDLARELGVEASKIADTYEAVFTPRSLDQPMGDGEGATLGDVLEVRRALGALVGGRVTAWWLETCVGSLPSSSVAMVIMVNTYWTSCRQAVLVFGWLDVFVPIDCVLPHANTFIQLAVSLCACSPAVSAESRKACLLAQQVIARTAVSPLPLTLWCSPPAAAVLQDERMLDAEDAAHIESLKQDLEAVLTGLHPREAGVLRMRFGLLDGMEHTLDDIGAQYNVSLCWCGRGSST